MIRGSVCGPKPSGTAWPCVVDGEGDGGGGLADGVAQQRGGVPGRGRLVVLAGGVEADDGVEVDDAACLVFGHLDVAGCARWRGRVFWVTPASRARWRGR